MGAVDGAQGRTQGPDERRHDPGRNPLFAHAHGAWRDRRGQRSFADLKARSVVEIDPGLIDPGGLADRLESDADADATLRQSIADHGQQVPVLVRPHPQAPGRFQIVFGRRRVLALRDLGQQVKALIRDLTDQELVLAQGQENTARRDLSFIEKVNFARQLQEHGYDRKVICDALSVDKTLISRMLSLAERIPPDVIAMIGAAPSIGRDRWTALADLLEKTDAPGPEIEAMINLKSQAPDRMHDSRPLGPTEQPRRWQPVRGTGTVAPRTDPCCRWPGPGRSASRHQPLHPAPGPHAGGRV